jgi:hypothetical protein
MSSVQSLAQLAFFTMIYSAALTLALFFSPVRALPQGCQWRRRCPMSSTYLTTTSPYYDDLSYTTTSPLILPRPRIRRPPPFTPRPPSHTRQIIPPLTPYIADLLPLSTDHDPVLDKLSHHDPVFADHDPVSTIIHYTPYSTSTKPYYPPITTPLDKLHHHHPLFANHHSLFDDHPLFEAKLHMLPDSTTYSSSTPYPYEHDGGNMYPPSECPCPSSTPYSSTPPPYTSPAYPPKPTTAYPPVTTPYAPSKPNTPTPYASARHVRHSRSTTRLALSMASRAPMARTVSPRASRRSATFPRSRSSAACLMSRGTRLTAARAGL